MLNSVNDRQVGGTHYSQVGDFQHWDLVIHTKMHYLLGCCTKYLFRWRGKNGLEDLKKAIHYLEKYQEMGTIDKMVAVDDAFISLITAHFKIPPREAFVVKSLISSHQDLYQARIELASLIKDVENGHYS